MAAALRDGGGQAEFGVWAENWDILTAFLAVDTQWRAIPLPNGVVYYMGLDYAGARAGLEAAGIALAPDQWRALRSMERAARDALNGIRG